MRMLDVVAGVLWRDGKYLAVRRPIGKPLEGWWEFPGGKVESGEDSQNALIRELREELDVETLASELWRTVEHTYAEKDMHVTMQVYHVRVFDGEPRPKEGQILLWVKPEQALDLDFLPADLPLVQELATARG